MNSLAQQTRYTPDDLLGMPDGDRYELVDGQLVERAMGSESSWIGGELFLLLGHFVKNQNLGWVWPSSSGYCCFLEDPNKLRRPDVSFIRRGRLPGERPSTGWETIPPDLAVEVISPNESFTVVEEKVEEYLRAAVKLVWVVNPQTRTALVHRADGSVARLHEDDELDGEDVLPGFRCRLGDLFPSESEDVSQPRDQSAS